MNAPNPLNTVKIRSLDKAPGRNMATILSHTLFIILLFVLPELVLAIALPHRSHWTFYPGFYVKTLTYLGVFYLNYFLLVDKKLGREHPRIWQFVALNAGVILLTLLINYGIQVFINPAPRTPRRWEELTTAQRIAGMTSFVLRDAVMLVLAIGLAVALRLSARWSEMQLQRQQLLSEQRSIELASLKSQLNPHFLFNTLNSVYALIDINPEDARSAVHKLSGMLRYMLYEDKPMVPLAREAEFVQNYLSLMQLRLRVCDHPLNADVLSGADAEGVNVPPLIFIPLIENALKYGVNAPEGAPIDISIALDENEIVCRTVNAFFTFTDKKEGGIGLANLRRRLTLIYGSGASLKTSVAGETFTALLRLPLKPEAAGVNQSSLPQE